MKKLVWLVFIGLGYLERQRNDLFLGVKGVVIVNEREVVWVGMRCGGFVK